MFVLPQRETEKNREKERKRERERERGTKAASKGPHPPSLTHSLTLFRKMTVRQKTKRNTSQTQRKKEKLITSFLFH